MITSNGISLKRNGNRKGFNWKQLEDLKGSALDVGGETVPWKDVQAELDKAGVDLDSQEIQDKITAQEQAEAEMQPTQEEKDRAAARRQLKSDLSQASPTSNPELAKEVDNLKKYLGLL